MSLATRVLRRAIVPILRRLLPRRLKRALKRWWDPNVIVSSDEMRIMIARAAERSAQTGIAAPKRPPVICFSIFPWEFRRQRPQHLLSRLVQRGHRVFYVERTTASLRRTTEVRPVENGVDEVLLALPRAFIDLEHEPLSSEIVDSVLDTLKALREKHDLYDAVTLVQMPSWTPIALEARRRFGWRIVYDCMDDWEHFPTVAPAVADAERTLVREADQVTVSSDALYEKWKTANPACRIVRNGVEVEHFRRADDVDVLGDVPRPVIGYVGAIAEWFDVDAVAAAATALPTCTFVLVGRVTNISVAALEQLPNVRLLGEKPYDVVPAYLSAFDVCLIPFRSGPLMSGTNPVKLYEYFSLGKPVVSSPMPEVMQHGELVYVASSREEWASRIEEALAERDDARREARVKVAQMSDWDARTDLVERAITEAHPKLSIVVVTFNNAAMTRLCLDSIEENVVWPNREVIVVDNASTDSTREDLKALPNLRLILNDQNLGFAAAMNQGIADATGDRLLLLNNDTILPSPLTGALMRHLDDPATGLVVAVTNFSGNESRIDVDYDTFEGIEPFAVRRRAEHDGERFDIAVAALYCVALTRETLNRVGPLDERFGIGMFEDDDYSQRVRAAGLRVVCAEDAFVHHFGKAAFGQIPSADYDRLFAANREKFEEKWGTWKGHRGR